MNFLVKSAMNIARSCAAIPRNSIGGNNSSLLRMCGGGIQGSIFGAARLGAVCLTNIMQGFTQMREGSTLSRIHRKGFFVKQKKKKSPLDGKPFAKGTVVKTIIRKPKKPNSANRKCVIVRLSTGKEMAAYVPGIGHNLQEHNVVLCKVGRLQDTPGVKIKCVRGKYDLPHVVKRQNK